MRQALAEVRKVTAINAPRPSFVIEFRNGSLFRGPRSSHGGAMGEAMRFQQEKHATAYINRRAPWAWFHGAMVVRVPRSG